MTSFTVTDDVAVFICFMCWRAIHQPTVDSVLQVALNTHQLYQQPKALDVYDNQMSSKGYDANANMQGLCPSWLAKLPQDTVENVEHISKDYGFILLQLCSNVCDNASRGMPTGTRHGPSCTAFLSLLPFPTWQSRMNLHVHSSCRYWWKYM